MLFVVLCIVLYCIVFYFIVFYCIVLYCVVLYIVLYCIVLYCIVFYCILLYLILFYLIFYFIFICFFFYDSSSFSLTINSAIQLISMTRTTLEFTSMVQFLRLALVCRRGSLVMQKQRLLRYSR